MKEIRVHGRGGQGVVTASEIIAISAFKDGFFSQAFPSFGVERTGAPIEAFARIDTNFIRTREQIYNPDIVIILDASLLGSEAVKSGVNNNTKILINTTLNPQEIIKKYPNLKNKQNSLLTIDATGIALKILGKNLANTVILGALAKQTEIITLKGLKQAISEKFSEKNQEIVKKNLKAVSIAYDK
ncbi:MAG: 2-oxoacid:acceptor oxidoreductase family protein [Candidatus Pacebacteria bacterium]|nr:2-oxoacid:acceptor oxidoreductase family protein [Candidatus Paceibacterota bacterium]